MGAPSRDTEPGTAHRLSLLGRDHGMTVKCLSPTGFLEEPQHLEEKVVRLKEIRGGRVIPTSAMGGGDMSLEDM